MPRESNNKNANAPSANEATATKFNLPFRAGMPALDSVIEVIPLAPPSAAQFVTAPVSPYRIIRTNEVDGYESIATSQGDLSPTLAAARAVPGGDKFRGTDRKAAKLSIDKRKTEVFGDLKDLINSLPRESEMVELDPPITRDSTMNRVDQEKRNVRISAFLYAASREDDNDFHLIIGRDPKTSPELYMTMEVSGLPPSNSEFFKRLKSVRDVYKNFFGDNLPGLTYDYYDPPIPVEIEGSLFFDVTHKTGQRPGPKSLKSRMPVIWEVHPVTGIVFEP